VRLGARRSGYWKCDGALDICISLEVVKSHSQGRQYSAGFVGYTYVLGSNRTNRRDTWTISAVLGTWPTTHFCSASIPTSRL